MADAGPVPMLLAFMEWLAPGAGFISLHVSRRKPGGAGEGLNTPSSGLVGRVGVLLAAEELSGRARIGDSDWPVRLSEGVEVGARVEVVQGMTLLVRSVL